MRLLFAVYAGILLLSAVGIPASGEPTGSSTLRSGSAPTMPPFISEIGGKANFPEEEDANTPALERKLKEPENGQVLNATIYNADGEKIGKVQQVLEDTGSGKSEYILFVSKESKL